MPTCKFTLNTSKKNLIKLKMPSFWLPILMPNILRMLYTSKLKRNVYKRLRSFEIYLRATSYVCFNLTVLSFNKMGHRHITPVMFEVFSTTLSITGWDDEEPTNGRRVPRIWHQSTFDVLVTDTNKFIVNSTIKKYG